MNIPKRFLLLSVYSVFLVLLFESAARLVYYIPLTSRRLLSLDDLSWRRRWVKRHQSKGKEIYYTFDRYDSTKGWISKSNLRNVQVFGDKVLNTNERGLRGTIDYAYRKPKNKFRILIVGDSFTFGDEVSDDETYSYQLQKMIPQVEVINFGVHGYGHDQMLIHLREEGVRYEPDIILLGFNASDMNRNLLSFRDFGKPKFVLEDRGLLLTGVPVPTPEEVLESDWSRPRVYDLASLIGHRWRKAYGSYEEDKNEITSALLREIVDLSVRNGALPVLVFLPTEARVSARDSLFPGEKYLFDLCRSIGGVRCFSASLHFAEKIRAGTVFKKKGHWKFAGHRATAEAIERYLMAEGLVPALDD